MSRLATLTRRGVLIGSVAVLGGAAFGVWRYRQPHPNPLLDTLPEGSHAITPYVRIDAQGVTVITPRAEMGQGVHTTLAALVAEELDVDWDDLRVEHGPPGAAYYNRAMLVEAVPFGVLDHSAAAEAMRGTMGVLAKFIGLQGTGGSSSLPDAFDKMRLAGAAARFALVAAAAQRLGVPASALKTASGAVVAPDGRRLSYPELAADAARVDLPDALPLKPRALWRYLGKSMPRVDMVGKCTGTATFGIDVRLPGMVFATVRMNPALDAPLTAFDATAAKAMRGVLQVVALPGGIGVVADNTWRAFQAAQAVRCTWGAPVYPPTTAALMDAVAASFDPRHEDKQWRNDGDVDQAMAAGQALEAEYRVPYLAHATMEPMNAVAWLQGGRLDLWTGTQVPTLARDQAAKVAGLDAAQVHVHTLPMGGGFGRRAESDYVLQAVRLAMAMPGKPVKLTWRREEDMGHDSYRPPAIARLRGATGPGTVLALDLRVASPSVLASQGGRIGLAPPGPDKLIADGLHDQPYALPHWRATTYRTPASVPVGSWRSVGNSFNGFFLESFLDELAHQADADPMALRRALLTHAPSRAVLEAVAKLSDWETPLEAGRGRGLAFHLSFGVPVAEVVEVTATPQGIRIDQLSIAADVGTALDPRNIEAQLQSGALFGLSAAVFGEITFAGGAVEQGNFHQYDTLRMAQVPRIRVQVLEGGGPLRGVGEPGTPPAAPALANAIFRATGQRIRTLPLRQHIAFV
ncbi:xanthine dehydrogenase family protein molybdopterin-binding subunit [Sphaerotilus sp.]|uniref:xanthine dehydrogenase family protein molybdopterin-binding subunit n=1 Tax=Sphaerotilus sp. TaxID=2093942 RepID=UPI002ACE8BC5|nr:molybdopterin cofactor-binding domain-containing protein [Sphaerotilus sp.]MDZ7859011.1 molybdopterin cofactor-binding domain-containing protein [Sphaerotilus sp.]